MKCFLMLAMLASSSAFASDANLLKVKNLALQYARGSDIEISVTKSDEATCGAEGPTYVAAVWVRKYVQTLDSNGIPTLKGDLAQIQTYKIPASELAAGATDLMAEGQCME